MSLKLILKAARSGKVGIVARLHEKGIPLTWDLLEVACEFDHLAMVEYLLDKGLNVNENNGGAMFYTIQNKMWDSDNRVAIVELLLTRGLKVKKSHIYMAFDFDRLDIVEIISSRCDIDSPFLNSLKERRQERINAAQTAFGLKRKIILD